MFSWRIRCWVVVRWIVCWVCSSRMDVHALKGSICSCQTEHLYNKLTRNTTDIRCHSARRIQEQLSSPLMPALLKEPEGRCHHWYAQRLRALGTTNWPGGGRAQAARTGSAHDAHHLGTKEFLTLMTEAWPYSSNQLQNLISISKACELLATGYETIDFDIEGSGIHGYA